MESPLSPLSSFTKQFSFDPFINNKEALMPYKQVIICGMGGSAICVSLLKLLFPELPITLHNSYGLPSSYDKKSTLLIINSYSGNTEEELEAFERAKKDGANMAAISLGGILIQRAKENTTAYIELPESSLEPRFSIGHQIIGLLSLMGEERKISILRQKIALLDQGKVESSGRMLASKFNGICPVIYASSNLYSVAYLIKAAINEGSKVPAFVSILPEANHNELQSFVTDEATDSSNMFGFLLLTSTYDHVRILKRFSIMETMYRERGFTVITIGTDHTDILDIFTLVVAGYHMATYMAIAKHVDPYKTPFIAEFKRRLTQS